MLIFFRIHPDAGEDRYTYDNAGDPTTFTSDQLRLFTETPPKNRRPIPVLWLPTLWRHGLATFFCTIYPILYSSFSLLCGGVNYIDIFCLRLIILLSHTIFFVIRRYSST